MTAEVVAVTGDRVSLRFEGKTRNSQTGRFFTQDTIGTAWKAPAVQNRGYDAKLLGHAVFNRKEQKFVSFELLAAGDRWARHIRERSCLRRPDLPPSRAHGSRFRVSWEQSRGARAAHFTQGLRLEIARATNDHFNTAACAKRSGYEDARSLGPRSACVKVTKMWSLADFKEALHSALLLQASRGGAERLRL